MTEKVRKRSMTTYEALECEDMLFDPERTSHQRLKKGENSRQNNQQNLRIKTFKALRSKKAQLFNKYNVTERKGDQKSSEATYNSTIESLKRQVRAIESEEFFSFRESSENTLNEAKDDLDAPHIKKEEQEVLELVRKCRKSKNQILSDKFRKKGAGIYYSSKDKLNSLDSSKPRLKSLPSSNAALISSVSEKFHSEKQRSVSSSTLRRFYRSKSSLETQRKEKRPFIMSQKSNSVVRLQLDNRRSLKTLLSL